MNTEKIGIELAKDIMSATIESLEDISETLGLPVLVQRELDKSTSPLRDYPAFGRKVF